MENKKKSIISCFIPGYVPNRVVAGVFGFISFCTGSVANNKRQEHLDANDEYLRISGILTPSNFIENQTMWNGVLFGTHKKSNMAYSGCEIIATYNALTSLGNRNIRMPELINNFEKKGAALKGGFGVAPSAPASFLKKRGYKIKRTFSRKKPEIDTFGNMSETFLVTYYWDRDDIREQLHTVNISKNNSGFYVHNVYCKNREGTYVPKGPSVTLGEAIFSIGPKVMPIVIYGVSRSI